MYVKLDALTNRYIVVEEKIDDSCEEIIVENNEIISPIGFKTQLENDELYSLNQTKISEAKAYLANTDYKMLPNYIPKADEDLDAIIVKRNEARELIRGQHD